MGYSNFETVKVRIDEGVAFNRTLSLEESRCRMRRFVENGGQTRELEANASGLGSALAKNFD